MLGAGIAAAAGLALAVLAWAFLRGATSKPAPRPPAKPIRITIHADSRATRIAFTTARDELARTDRELCRCDRFPPATTDRALGMIRDYREHEGDDQQP